MKNKQAEQYTSARWRLPSKWSYSMKIGSLALTGIFLSISAVAFPQRVTVKMENATLKQFLEQVQTQVDVALLYSDQLVANKRITVNTKNRDFKELLSKELPKYHLTFKESDGQITIVPHSSYHKGADREEVRQEKITIKGRVFNSEEPPQALENVSISIKGGASVGRTGAGGYYDVAVPKGSQLVFTLVGYRPYEVLVNKNENNLSLSLQENVADVEEVVVVGMTEMQKKHIASSVATLDVKSNIEGKPITNLSQALQGGVTGLNVQQGSGLPGGDAATIKIRGISTMNNSDPLVLVDGVPMDMNHIDPVTVESVTILKDAAAAAMYGARAANGVILITTKRGKAGQINVLYDGYYGMQTPTLMPEFVDAATYMRTYNYAALASGEAAFFDDEQIRKTESGEDPINFPNTNWTKEVIDEYAPLTSHSLALSGGNDVARFAITGNYMYQKGMLPVNKMDRFNIRANTSVSLSKKFLVNLDVLGIRRNVLYPNRGLGNGGIRMLDDLYRLPPNILPKYPAEEGWPTIYGRYADIVNPVAYAEVGGSIGYQFDQATINLQPKWTITDNLNLTGQFSYRLNSDVYKQNRDNFYFFDYYSKQLVQTWAVQRNSYSDKRDTYIFGSGALDYSKRFDKHNVFALGGFSIERFNEGYWDMSALASAYSKVNYSYDDRYLAELAFRADGSSKFGADNKWGYFPSVAVGWNVHNEGFFKLDAINNLKLRASYGHLGNENIGYYQYQNLINETNGTESVWGNPDISWEKVRITDLGFDMSLFNNKFALTFDYYDKLTTDMLMRPMIPPSGSLGAIRLNAGKVMNRGVEAQITYNEQITPDLFISVKPGITYNKNKILELAGGVFGETGIIRQREGYALGSYYGYVSDGILQLSNFDEYGRANVLLANQSQGPGDIHYKDLNQDGVINDDDQQMIGDPTPRINYFANFSVNYKKFDIEVLLQGAGNHDYSANLGGKSSGYLWHPLNMSASGGVPTTYRAANSWRENNQDAIYPRIKTTPGTNVFVSDFWLFNARYMRVKFIQAGYRLSGKTLNKYGIKSSRIYLNAQNPFLFSGVKMADPESQGGSWTYGIMKTFTVGLTANF